MPLMLLLLKQNYLQSDVVSTKPFKYIMQHISLSSLMLYTLQEGFLIPCPIFINYNQLQFLKILQSFSIKALTILLISGIVLAVSNSLTIQLSTKRPNSWITFQSFYINHLGILGRRKKEI